MNIKKFQSVCRLTSILLILTAVFSLLSVAMVGFWSIRGGDVSFSLFSNFTIVQSARNTIDFPYQNTVDIFFAIPLMAVLFYSLLKGSKLFKQLANGQTPFSKDFSRSLKVLGLVLIVTDVFAPLLYSTVLTLLIEDGHYFHIHFSSPLIIGLILYAGAHILNYGKELQHLSDHTV